MEMILTPLEQRVLGALIEKEMATPDYYPMTLNSLTLACNQKSNRQPVTSYSESEVMKGFDSLKRQGLAMPSAESGRVPKYRHCLVEELHLQPEEAAILCVLLLRGPQTVGELRTRTERMHPFADLGSLETTLEDLSSRQPALVRRMERQPGQKEARYQHLLGDATEENVGEQSSPVASATEDRIATLEQQVAILSEEMEQLKEKLKDLLE
jgi:uncharacterized protein YceH (UPF0502 family)